MHRPVLLALSTLPLLAGCTTAPESALHASRSGGGASAHDLAGDLAGDLVGWTEVSPFAFEQLVESALPEDRITELDDFLLAACEEALDLHGPLSVRAAVILGRGRGEKAGELLIDHLEKRVLGPGRTSDVGDCTAAAALLRFPDANRYAKRLEALAHGSDPHPDLEVRVECACSALGLGRDAVIPFLLCVLRIGTPAGERDERDFPASETTAWARGRAATALSRRAELPVGYRTDAPLADREAEVEKLRHALSARGILE
jgi:hypothetical protein